MEAHIYVVRRILNLNVFSVDIKFWDPVGTVRHALKWWFIKQAEIKANEIICSKFTIFGKGINGSQSKANAPLELTDL